MYEFDAVLLDHEMRDMNGCDVAFEIERVRPVCSRPHDGPQEKQEGFQQRS